MKPSLQAFLQELYAIDSSLRDHESEVLPLLELILKTDPGTSPDEEFVKRLRMRLKNHASVMSSIPAASPVWQKLLYALSGAATVAVILPVAFVAWNSVQDVQSPSQSATDGSSLFAYRIEEAGENAFGPLTDVTVAPASAGMGGGGERNQAGGGSGNVPAMAPMADMAMRADAKIAPFPMTQINYVYDGEIKDLQATVNVLRRNAKGSRVPLGNISNMLNLGMLDLDSFSGMNVESLSFAQNVPYGYMMNVNLRDATLNIDAQWDQWPQSRCSTDACFQAQRVKISEIPADEQLIAIAKNFASSHGIDLGRYGEPEVQHQWKMEYDRTPDKSQAYIPDSLQVVFPFMIDGQATYDQSGAKSGIIISVHVKEKKVMSVWGIADRTYAESSYAGVTDPKVIKDFLGKMDNYFGIADSRLASDIKNVSVKLGTPTLAYATYFRYANDKTDELLVPSLIFPVESVEGETQMYVRNQIVVPLAADLLKEQSGGGVMPFMEAPAQGGVMMK